MFRNRQVTVKLEKKTKNADQPVDHFIEEATFERKTDHILSEFEALGMKVFAGVCIYVLLDTFRQVQVAKASNPNN